MLQGVCQGNFSVHVLHEEQKRERRAVGIAEQAFAPDRERPQRRIRCRVEQHYGAKTLSVVEPQI